MDSRDGNLIGWRQVAGEFYIPHYFQRIKATGPVSLCRKFFSIEEDLVLPQPGQERCATCVKKAEWIGDD